MGGKELSKSHPYLRTSGQLMADREEKVYFLQWCRSRGYRFSNRWSQTQAHSSSTNLIQEVFKRVKKKKVNKKLEGKGGGAGKELEEKEWWEADLIKTHYMYV